MAQPAVFKKIRAMSLHKSSKLLDEMIKDLEKSLGLPFSKDPSGKGQVPAKSEAASAPPTEKKKDEAGKQVRLL